MLPPPTSLHSLVITFSEDNERQHQPFYRNFHFFLFKYELKAEEKKELAKLKGFFTSYKVAKKVANEPVTLWRKTLQTLKHFSPSFPHYSKHYWVFQLIKLHNNGFLSCFLVCHSPYIPHIFLLSSTQYIY